jgi:hypothetical protein
MFLFGAVALHVQVQSDSVGKIPTEDYIAIKFKMGFVKEKRISIFC